MDEREHNFLVCSSFHLLTLHLFICMQRSGTVHNSAEFISTVFWPSYKSVPNFLLFFNLNLKDLAF